MSHAVAGQCVGLRRTDANAVSQNSRDRCVQRLREKADKVREVSVMNNGTHLSHLMLFDDFAEVFI